LATSYRAGWGKGETGPHNVVYLGPLPGRTGCPVESSDVNAIAYP